MLTPDRIAEMEADDASFQQRLIAADGDLRALSGVWLHRSQLLADRRALERKCKASFEDGFLAAEQIHGKLTQEHMAKSDALAARLERAMRVLRAERDELRRRTNGRTHYEGCAADHPMCAAIQRLDTALKELSDEA